jgi:hypothetical protein
MNIFICTNSYFTEYSLNFFKNLFSELNNSNNLFKAFIISHDDSIDNLVDYDTDFIIYAEFIKGNPLKFKNVIRFFFNSVNKDLYETFESTDLLFFKNEEILSTTIYDVGLYHPDIVDYYNDDLHSSSIIFDINSSFKENVKNFKDVIMKRSCFQNVRFTDPIISIFNKDGLQTNTIPINVVTNVISIEVDFIINSYDFDYENLFDLNYGSLNVGPRLEINNKGILSLVLGNSFQDYEGYVFNDSSSINVSSRNSLKIVINKNVITYNFNNNIGTFETKKDIFNLNDVVVSGGVNSDRVFKSGTIFNFKLYNYVVPIFKELNHYFPNFDTWYLQYPKKVFSCLCKYEKLDIKYHQSFHSMTFRFILNLKKDCTFDIINMKDIVIYKDCTDIFIKLQNYTYLLFSNIFLNKSYILSK